MKPYPPDHPSGCKRGVGETLAVSLHLAYIGIHEKILSVSLLYLDTQRRFSSSTSSSPLLWAMRIGRDKSGSHTGFIPPDIAPLFVLFARLHVLALL